MRAEGMCGEASPAPDHTELRLWQRNEVTLMCLSDRRMVQAINSRGAGLPWEEEAGRGGRQAGRAKAAWPAGRGSLLAGLEIQDSGQGQEQDTNSAWSVRLGIMVTDSAAWSNLRALTSMPGGLGCPPAHHRGAEPQAQLPGQGPAVHHRLPTYKKVPTHFSKLEIAFLFLS